MLKRVKDRYHKEQFYPTIIAIFVNPFYFARKGLYVNIVSLSKNIYGKVLDVGCGQKPYERFYTSSEYIGLEIDSSENRSKKKADFFYDGKMFPFKNSEFDCVISNEVIEHVFEPDIFFSEINRVLKVNGFLLISVPFVWEEHEIPYDYARYSSFGLKSLLAKYHFEVIEHIKSMNDIRAVFQLFNCFIHKKFTTNNKYFNYIIMLFIIAPINILGEILAKVFPKNDDFYLDNIILAKKINSI